MENMIAQNAVLMELSVSAEEISAMSYTAVQDAIADRDKADGMAMATENNTAEDMA